MAQYGDPSNLIRPPFRRHTPTNTSNPGNAQGSGSPANPRLTNPSPQPTSFNLKGQNGQNSASNLSSNFPANPPLNLPGSPKPSENALQAPNFGVNRRRNQWREHHQRQPQPPAPEPQSTSQPRNLSPQPFPTTSAGSGTPSPVMPRRPLDYTAPTNPLLAVGRDVAPGHFPVGSMGSVPLGTTSMGSVPTLQRPETSVRRRSSSKVTPLRSRAPRSLSPAPVSSDRTPGRPRRKSHPAPLPVLYAIRLLILGVGVAAIAGTLLSVLTPSEVSISAQPADAQTENGAGVLAGMGLRGKAARFSVADIPLKEEIAPLKTELERLGTLTPGLKQYTFLLDLDTGRYVNIGDKAPVAAASTIKVPIFVAFLRAVDAGTVKLDQAMVLQPQHIASGSGDFQFEPVGTQFTALEVATYMIVNSDNTATNMIIELLGGAGVLNPQFSGWGLSGTVIRNPLPDLEGTNTTSAHDLAMLMAMVDEGHGLSMRSRDLFFSTLQRTYNRSLIPSGINPDSGAIIVNKTGDIMSVLGDVALVDAPNGKRYVLATLVQRPDNDGRAGELIRRVSELTYKEMSQPMKPVNPPPSTVAPPSPTPGSTPSPTPDPTGQGAPQPMVAPPQGGEPLPRTPVPQGRQSLPPGREDSAPGDRIPQG